MLKLLLKFKYLPILSDCNKGAYRRVMESNDVEGIAYSVWPLEIGAHPWVVRGSRMEGFSFPAFIVSGLGKQEIAFSSLPQISYLSCRGFPGWLF